MKQIKLGKKVRVSDPCYGTDVWCAGTIDNVKEGIYNVEVEMLDEGMWGNRVKSLTVTHSEYKDIVCFTEEADFEVGVDSGQAGFYDEEYYQQYHTEEECNDDWYDAICNLTLSRAQYGTKDEKCVVSSSGYGDGGYTCYIARNDKHEVIALMIEFITDDNDDYEEDDE